MTGTFASTSNHKPEAPSANKGLVLHTRVVTQTGGGPDKTILNSPRFLKSMGYRSACAYMHPPEDDGFAALQDKAESAGARLLSVPDRGIWDVSVFRRLLQICREENVAIWHAHDYKSNALGLAIRRFHRMKLVTTVHGWGVQDSRRVSLYYWVDRRCLPRYDHVLCVSKDLVAICNRAGVSPERLSLIHNAIDLEGFHRSRTQEFAKAELNLPADRIVIGAVGRLSAEKGFDRLIRATSQLAEEGLPVYTVIIGEGQERPNLERLIGELGARRHVELTGFRSDVKRLFEAMDIFALSSVREGLPNVVLEAMAMGVPVVATRVAGTPELIRHNENGLLVDIGDDDQFIVQLNRAAISPAFRLQLATKARSTIEQKFSFENRMREVGEIYDTLLT